MVFSRVIKTQELQHELEQVEQTLMTFEQRRRDIIMELIDVNHPNVLMDHYGYQSGDHVAMTPALRDRLLDRHVSKGSVERAERTGSVRVVNIHVSPGDGRIYIMFKIQSTKAYLPIEEFMEAVK